MQEPRGDAHDIREDFADLPDLPESSDEEDDDDADEEEDVLIDEAQEQVIDLEMSLEDFFTGLLPTGASREDALRPGREALLMDFRDLLASGGRSLIEVPRELNESTAAMNLFRILEGRRPQTSVRIDSRDLVSIPGNANDSVGAVDASLSAPSVQVGPLFGTLESSMQI